jgi:hypothetical protein
VAQTVIARIGQTLTGLLPSFCLSVSEEIMPSALSNHLKMSLAVASWAFKQGKIAGRTGTPPEAPCANNPETQAVVGVLVQSTPSNAFKVIDLTLMPSPTKRSGD